MQELQKIIFFNLKKIMIIFLNLKKEILKMTILDLKNGDKFKVKKVKISKEIGKRLVDMGFTFGVTGKVKRCALLGDPIEVEILGYNISIRKSEADGIEIEKIIGA